MFNVQLPSIEWNRIGSFTFNASSFVDDDSFQFHRIFYTAISVFFSSKNSKHFEDNKDSYIEVAVFHPPFEDSNKNLNFIKTDSTFSSFLFCFLCSEFKAVILTNVGAENVLHTSFQSTTMQTWRLWTWIYYFTAKRKMLLRQPFGTASSSKLIS